MGRIQSKLARYSKLVVAVLLTTANNPVLAAEAVRKGHLDYLNVETLQHYMTVPASAQPYDVAIMFYAQWCRNCHALAPMWDQIATNMQAGTTRSGVIMGLFDCEANDAHAATCSALHITHYPTLQFFSLSANTLRHKRPRHVVPFHGNWMYGEAILDWLRVCLRVSSWKRSNGVWSWLFGRKKKGEAQLPVGVPTIGKLGGTVMGPSSTRSGGGGSSSDAAALKKLQSQNDELTQLVLRSSTMLEAILLPVTLPNNTTTLLSDNGMNYTDVFATVNWHDVIVATCVQEVALDYCQRVQNQILEDWVDTFANITDITEDAFESFQTRLPTLLAAREPYCAVIETCIVKDMQPASTCQPRTCPFVNTVACRYVTACLTSSLQDEYKEALREAAAATAAAATSKTAANKKVGNEEKPTTESKSGGGSWGMRA